MKCALAGNVHCLSYWTFDIIIFNKSIAKTSTFDFYTMIGILCLIGLGCIVVVLAGIVYLGIARFISNRRDIIERKKWRKRLGNRRRL
jgi:hypothetical protein